MVCNNNKHHEDEDDEDDDVDENDDIDDGAAQNFDIVFQLHQEETYLLKLNKKPEEYIKLQN